MPQPANMNLWETQCALESVCDEKSVTATTCLKEGSGGRRCQVSIEYFCKNSTQVLILVSYSLIVLLPISCQQNCISNT